MCWKNFRKINDQISPEQGAVWTPFVTVDEVLEKAGEIASAVKDLEASDSPEKTGNKDLLATRLSDLLYEVFVLAEHYGIELEDSFMQTVNDYMLNVIK
jgi:NTP pyrophosphatase (non-canonical NTP hydrolase)